MIEKMNGTARESTKLILVGLVSAIVFLPVVSAAPTYTATPTHCYCCDGGEVDDSYLQANWIPINDAVGQYHELNDFDQDWVKFDAVAGQEYIIDTWDNRDLVVSMLYLYDTDGTTLLASDENSTPFCFVGFPGISAKIVWTAPANGTYFVMHESYCPVGGSNCIYRLYYLRVSTAGFLTVTPTVVLTRTPTLTETRTHTPSLTGNCCTYSFTSTQTPTGGVSKTHTPTNTPGIPGTGTPTGTPTHTPTHTETQTLGGITYTVTSTDTPTKTATHTRTHTPGGVPGTHSSTFTPTNTATPFGPGTPSVTPTHTCTDTPSATRTITPTCTLPAVPGSATATSTVTSTTVPFPPIVDSVPPTFQVVAVYDPSAPGVIEIRIVASEKIAGNALDEVKVVPQGGTQPEHDITASFSYAGGNTFVCEYTLGMGESDLNAIIVTGRDIAGNVGISDGGFKKETSPSAQKVLVKNSVIDPTKGEKVVIEIKLDHPTMVKVTIYDMTGALVKTLVDGMRNASFTAVWEGVNAGGSIVASGVYIVTVETDTWTETMKVIVKK